jgi:hypothetical protein
VKLYTLQQCFEQAGEKFPFTVYWSAKNSDLARNITFIRKDENRWYHEDVVLMNNFFCWPKKEDEEKTSYFNYDIIQYKKDFEDLLL